jgi:hypothetical protein
VAKRLANWLRDDGQKLLFGVNYCPLILPAGIVPLVGAINPPSVGQNRHAPIAPLHNAIVP